MPKSRPNVFRYFQRFTKIHLPPDLIDPSNPDTPPSSEPPHLIVWSPTRAELTAAQDHLFARWRFWMSEDKAQVTQQVEEFIQSFPNKRGMIGAILLATAADRVRQSMDLIDPKAKAEIDRGTLSGFTTDDIEVRWGIKPTGREAISKFLALQTATRELIAPIIKDREGFITFLDESLAADLHRRYLEEETKGYESKSDEEIRQLLEFINRRSIAFGMAQEEYYLQLATVLTRYPSDNGAGRGETVFAQPKWDEATKQWESDITAENFIGNAQPELLRQITQALQGFLDQNTPRQIREASVDPNSPPSTT